MKNENSRNNSSNLIKGATFIFKIKRIIPLFLLVVLLLVGCGNRTEDVTDVYFSEAKSYGIINNYLGESFNFDTGEFSFNVWNQENGRTEVYLPIRVNKVDRFGEYDVIQFDFELENSNVPDYDWTQHYKRTSISRTETFTRKIINDRVKYIIKQIKSSGSSGENYLLVPYEGVDEKSLNSLLVLETESELLEMDTDLEYFRLTKE